MSDHLRGWLAATSAEERERVAREARTSVAHLWQLAGGHRKASPSLAERLQDASGGQITIAGLRPDLVGFAEKILRASIDAAPTQQPTSSADFGPILPSES
ncbi:hypothetical protein ACEP11_31415, partial [Pseudomonas aeruginosa]